MPSSPLSMIETAKFSVIERYEESNLMPAERAVRVGGKRVAAHRRPEARVAGERVAAVKGESKLLADSGAEGDVVDASIAAAKRAAHGAVAGAPPTKLTMKHLDGMVEADSKRDHREHKDPPKHAPHASPRPNVNSGRANKMGSNKRT